jgi:hypothetical protein
VLPREHAQGLYDAIRGMGRGKVFGGDMELVTAERLALLDRAAAAITKAIGEPASSTSNLAMKQLARMLEHVQQIRADIESRQVTDGSTDPS